MTKYLYLCFISMKNVESNDITLYVLLCLNYLWTCAHSSEGQVGLL